MRRLHLLLTSFCRLGDQVGAERWFALRWPRELPPSDVLAWLRHVSVQSKPRIMAIELVASSGKSEYRIGVGERDERDLRRAFASFLPGVLLEPIVCPAFVPTHVETVALTNQVCSLRTDTPERTAQSVASAVHHGGNNYVVIRWTLGRRITPHPVSPQSMSHANESLAHWAARQIVYGNPPERVHERRTVSQKHTEPGITTSIAIGASGKTDTAKGQVHRVCRALGVMATPEVRWRTRRSTPRCFERISPVFPTSVLSVSELMATLAWPLGDSEYPGVHRERSTRQPVPAAVPTSGIVLGDGSHPSTLRPVAIAPQELAMHAHIIGATGTGKSTLLQQMALQLLAARQSVVVIDGKGDLAAELLTRIPATESDVVVIDPTDAAPIGINPLTVDSPEMATDHVMATFRALYGETLGVRTSDVLHASVLTLATAKQPMPMLPYLLSDEGVRRHLVTALGSAALQEFWRWYDALSPGQRQQVTAPVMNKLRPFLLRSAVHATLSQASPRFRLKQLFERPMTVVVSLGSGTLGSETAHLIGSLLLAELWQTAKQQVRIPSEKRRPVRVILDEFQNLLHLPTDLGEALAEARGFNVGLVLAHQHLGQLGAAMRLAVLANARSRVCFQSSLDDARILAGTSERVHPLDIARLGRFEALMSLMANYEVQEFASVSTRPLPAACSDPTAIREASRKRFGVSRQETEAAFAGTLQRLRGMDEKTPVGSKKRRAS